MTLAARKPLKRSSWSGPVVLLDRRCSALTGIMSPPERAHVDIAQILGLGAVGAFGLQLHAVGVAELVEVVDVEHAHRALQRVEHVFDRHAERHRLLAIDIDEQLRRGRTIERCDAGQVGTLAQSPRNCCTSLVELLRVGVGAVLQVDFETAGGAKTADRRRIERKHRCLRDLAGVREV